MISFRHKGDFKKLDKYLKEAKKPNRIIKILERFGEQGVAALASATPVDTGKTAASWSYEIKSQNGSYTIRFNNSNINKYVNIAIILQYGHATRNGGWVEGRDYINPAIRPIFDQITDQAWEEVTKL